MLNDSTVAYERIARSLGLTKQRIGQLAKDFAVDGRQCERERISRREPYIKKREFSQAVLAIIRKLKRLGIHVQTCNLMQRTQPRVGARSTRMIFVNGSLCSIQVRKGHKLAPTGRDYVRFEVSGETRRTKFALWTVKNGNQPANGRANRIRINGEHSATHRTRAKTNRRVPGSDGQARSGIGQIQEN